MAEEFNPYQSPAANSLEPPGASRSSASMRLFRSGTIRARVCIGAFAFMILVNLTGLFAMANQWKMLQSARNGREIPTLEANASDLHVTIVGFIEIAMNLVLAITFLSWMHRAHANLPALGARELQFTPGWAVGWWFVPFANLVKPCQIASEIWRASDPDTVGQSGSAWKSAPGSILIGGWWLMFLLARFASRFLGMGGKSIQTLDDALNLTAGGIVVELICIAAAVLAILVVHRTNDRQEFKHDRLRNGDSSPPPQYSPAFLPPPELA